MRLLICAGHHYADSRLCRRVLDAFQRRPNAAFGSCYDRITAWLTGISSVHAQGAGAAVQHRRDDRDSETQLSPQRDACAYIESAGNS
jgi:hypothetical protein